MSNKIKNQLDWAEFRDRIEGEVASRATSNKALLWVSIGVLTAFNIATLVLTLTVLFHCNALSGELNVIKVRVGAVESLHAQITDKVTEATKAYSDATAVLHRTMQGSLR